MRERIVVTDNKFGKRVELIGKGKVQILGGGELIVESVELSPSIKIVYPAGTIDSLKPLLYEVFETNGTQRDEAYWLKIDDKATMTPEMAWRKIKRANKKKPVKYEEVAAAVLKTDVQLNKAIAFRDIDQNGLAALQSSLAGEIKKAVTPPKKKTKIMLPDFSFEKIAARNGYKAIAGVDEVGRGCFAGPVVAAAVAWRQIPNNKFQIPNDIKIDDSKKLTAKQRELADVWIRENALGFGIGEASVSQINKFGIKKATEIAFRSAIAVVSSQIAVDYLLIDAFLIPRVKIFQKAIIKGDTKSLSIAAASIIAKVYRDKLMSKIPNLYGWEINKGYGTKIHREAIRKFGISRHHRKQFVRNYVFSPVL